MTLLAAPVQQTERIDTLDALFLVRAFRLGVEKFNLLEETTVCEG